MHWTIYMVRRLVYLASILPQRKSNTLWGICSWEPDTFWRRQSKECDFSTVIQAVLFQGNQIYIVVLSIMLNSFSTMSLSIHSSVKQNIDCLNPLLTCLRRVHFRGLNVGFCHSILTLSWCEAGNLICKPLLNHEIFLKHGQNWI